MFIDKNEMNKFNEWVLPEWTQRQPNRIRDEIYITVCWGKTLKCY